MHMALKIHPHLTHRYFTQQPTQLASTSFQPITMKLSDKGPIQPPPTMPGLVGHVAQEIQTWPGVIAATHWDLYRPGVADGADFYVGETEIGHLHFYGEAHIATNAVLGTRFIQENKAQPFRFRADTTYRHWTQVTIASQEKAQHAIDVFRANYERLLARQTAPTSLGAIGSIGSIDRPA